MLENGPSFCILGWPLSYTFIKNEVAVFRQKGPFPIKPFEPGVAAFHQKGPHLYMGPISNTICLKMNIRIDNTKKDT